MKSKKLLYIGLTAVFALLILVGGIEYLKGINLFHTSNYYFVTYESVTGLNVSAPVTANGFKVGQVREMKYLYNDPGHVQVELALDAQLKVPEGTVAVLGSDLLGTATIALEMPKSTNYAKVGSTLESRQSSGLMENVQADLLPSIAAIMPKIDSLLSALTAVVTDPALSATISRLDKISADLGTLSSNLAAASRPLPAVVSNVNDLTGRLDSLAAELNKLPLDETMANVEAITSNLKALSEQLQNKDSSLGMLLNDPGLYDNLNATVNSLDSLIVDVKRQPKRYLKFSVF